MFKSLNKYTSWTCTRNIITAANKEGKRWSNRKTKNWCSTREKAYRQCNTRFTTTLLPFRPRSVLVRATDKSRARDASGAIPPRISVKSSPEGISTKDCIAKRFPNHSPFAFTFFSVQRAQKGNTYPRLLIINAH